MRLVLVTLCAAGMVWSMPVQAAPLVAAERLAPRFDVRSVEGKRIALDTLLQQGPVLLDFWATWCKPCVTSLPAVQRLWEDHRAAGLTVVAVSIDGPRNFAKVRPFARGLGLTFPIVLDEDGSLARRFDVSAVPTSILIGRDGRIAHVQVGYVPGQEGSLAKAILAQFPSQAMADSAR